MSWRVAGQRATAPVHADVSGRLDCQAVQSKVQMVRGKKWDAAGKAADPAPVILVILLLHLVILAPAAPTAPAAPAPSRSGLIGVARLAKKN